jgi:hypothetical protein
MLLTCYNAAIKWLRLFTTRWLAGLQQMRAGFHTKNCYDLCLTGCVTLEGGAAPFEGSGGQDCS